MRSRLRTYSMWSHRVTTRQAHVREAPSRSNGMVYLTLLVLAVTVGGILWQASKEREDQIPRVAAPTEPYKVRPPEGVFATRDRGESQGDALDASQRDELRLGELRRDELRRDYARQDDLQRDYPRRDDLRGDRRRDELPRDDRWRDEQLRSEPQFAQTEPRQRRWSPAAPHIVANGPYVAQVEALQSEAGVEDAWRRLSARAPELFETARLDVERADLGPRGIFYRIRAGYFSDRANAERFCERVERMGQDCHVTGR